ncbi:hypothetical protein CHUAL_000493 [Chamberlinius hualienensis]
MEIYENLGIIGEGSYGVVMKCRVKMTGQTVAIKRFILKMNDELVRKVATREIKMLKMLKHENLVNLIDIFRRKGYLYLIMDYVDHNLLDELQKHPSGLSCDSCRPIIWQILRGLEFCHSKNIIHRDIKPENVLVSKTGVVKLCDFGFARIVNLGETCTDYVSTRWYRAPELLVGDLHYGKEVDMWAVGCLFAEMFTGNPLFPGDSDIDQLFCIIRVMGDLIPKHSELLLNNLIYQSLKPAAASPQPLSHKFPTWPKLVLDFVQNCLNMNPPMRSSASILLQHSYFTWDEFPAIYLPIIYNKLKQEFPSSASQSDVSDLKTISTSSPKRISHLPNLKKPTTDKVTTPVFANEKLSIPLDKLSISTSKSALTNSGIDASESPKISSQTFMPPITLITGANLRGTAKSTFNPIKGSSNKMKPSNFCLRSETVSSKANSELRLVGKRQDRSLNPIGDLKISQVRSGRRNKLEEPKKTEADED